MKPRTKLQVRVKALSDALPKLTNEQKQWAYKHCLKHWGYRTKLKTACMDCGHIWATADNQLLIVNLIETHYNCPACGTKLTIVDTRKKNVSQREFVGLITTVEDFQLNRFFEVKSIHKAGEKPWQYIREVVQQWLQPDGKNEVVAQNCGSMGWGDNFHGGLEIRNKQYLPNSFNINPTKVFPKVKSLPIYKRNGFKGKFGYVRPYDLFTRILTDSKAETLLKANQLGLLAARTSSRRYDIERFWDSIKICIRNKYIVKEDITWLDYLALLQHFGKDLHNPKYVCPANLTLEHDKLVAKKTEIDKRQRYTASLIRVGKHIDTLKNRSADSLQAEYDAIMAAKAEKEERKRYIKELLRFDNDVDTLESQTTEQLKTAYDQVISAKKAEEQAKAEERKKKQLQAEEIAYQKAKKAFLGLCFKSKDITIKLLESVRAFEDEAKIRGSGFCVFASGYYKKEDSLVFTAYVKGESMETIEVSLSQLKVVQARGAGNQATEHHEAIVGLVEKNMRLIKKAAKQPKNNQVAA